MSSAGHLAVADVDRDERAGDLLGVLHHARPRGLGPVGKDLGVAGKVDAGRVQRFLVERRGRDGRDLAGQRRVDGPLDVREARPARGGTDHARLHCVRNRPPARSTIVGWSMLAQSACHCAGEMTGARSGSRGGRRHALQNRSIAKDDRHALAGDRVVGQQVQADLRPDAGRVAHRDGDRGRCSW